MFVSELLDGTIEILGTCSKETALQRISTAVQALNDEGDWQSNIGVVDIRALKDKVTVTLPREVETPLAIAVAGQPAFMRDEFYRFHINGEGLFDENNVVPWAWDDQGNVACPQDIITPGPLIATVDNESDRDKIIRILGRDSSGRVLRFQKVDGTWIEGIQIPLIFAPRNAPSPVPVPNTLFDYTRQFSVRSIITLLRSAGNLFVTGQIVQLDLVAGIMPSPLAAGERYYVRAIGNEEVSLHRTRLAAQIGENAISFFSSDFSTQISLTDKRSVLPASCFEILPPESVPAGFPNFFARAVKDKAIVRFSFSETVHPLENDKNYFVKMKDQDKFSVHASVEDADANINPLRPSEDRTGVLNVLRKISFSAILDFGVQHNFGTGDAVTVGNSGGELPSPILENTQYYVRKISAKEITLHSTYSGALAGTEAIAFESEGTGVNSIIKMIAASAVIGDNLNVKTQIPHLLSQPSGSGATATANIASGTVVDVVVTAGGSGYDAAPFVVFPDPGAGKTRATGYANVANGVVTSITVVEGGTGYAGSSIGVTINPAGGSYIQFTTDGELPKPLAKDVVYRAEAPMTSDEFTVHNLDLKKINLQSSGSGNLFVVISRAFTFKYQPQVYGDFPAELATGMGIKLFTEGTFPLIFNENYSTPSQLNAVVTYFVRRISGGGFLEIYDTAANALNISGTIGRVHFLSRGGGTFYAVLASKIKSSIDRNSLIPDFSGFFRNDIEVQLETTDTLPAPLATATNYKVVMQDGEFYLSTLGGVPIAFTSVGLGEHHLVASGDFDPKEATQLDVVDNLFFTGEKVNILKGSVSADLPKPLSTAVDYFVRREDSNTLSLFTSKVDAENAVGEIGKVIYESQGSGDIKIVSQKPAPNVASISQIGKDLTSGFTRLYCAPYPGSTQLLGEFHPEETLPSFRRIKIAKSADWIRMRYRRRATSVLSEHDFIPLDSKMAVLMMVQSHMLLFKKFADESERYRKIAVEYLNRRNRAVEGPRTIQLQINADVISNPSDAMIN